MQVARVATNAMPRNHRRRPIGSRRCDVGLPAIAPPRRGRVGGGDAVFQDEVVGRLRTAQAVGTE